MKKIKIITDSACDLPIEYIKENQIDFVCLEVNIKGNFVKDDLGETLKYKDFYEILRSGEMTSTSQVNVYTFEEIFEKYILEGYSIIYIGLASVLSGTFNSAKVARENLILKYKDADISIIDSKSVSLGEGALVYYASEMIKTGKTKDYIVQWLENNRTKVIHAITVDSLLHLKRGGRISGTTAAFGTMLGIKPTLILDDEGRVIPGEKIKGRKKAIKYLANQIIERGVNIEEQVIFICHADCIEDAEELKNMIEKQCKVKKVIINSIGAVIGTHGGPGTLAAVFLGDHR